MIMARVIARLSGNLSARTLFLLAALGLALLTAPFFANDYLLTVLILILYFAYAGQAWNIMMGFAGQLSLGHVAFFGIGAYGLLPVAALPKVDFPTIVVSVNYPGASPDTMASAVATPLEQQFAAIPSLDQMTSTSGVGSLSITLQFDLSRNIDAATIPRPSCRSRAPGTKRRFPGSRCNSPSLSNMRTMRCAVGFGMPCRALISLTPSGRRAVAKVSIMASALMVGKACSTLAAAVRPPCARFARGLVVLAGCRGVSMRFIKKQLVMSCNMIFRCQSHEGRMAAAEKTALSGGPRRCVAY